MELPRIFHRIYAFWTNYFWIPCPICGKYFGGHEWQSEYTLWDKNFTTGKGICPRCGEKGLHLK
jgi:hypothetical protein